MLALKRGGREVQTRHFPRQHSARPGWRSRQSSSLRDADRWWHRRPGSSSTPWRRSLRGQRPFIQKTQAFERREPGMERKGRAYGRHTAVNNDLHSSGLVNGAIFRDPLEPSKEVVAPFMAVSRDLEVNGAVLPGRVLGAVGVGKVDQMRLGILGHSHHNVILHYLSKRGTRS